MAKEDNSIMQDLGYVRSDKKVSRRGRDMLIVKGLEKLSPVEIDKARRISTLGDSNQRYLDPTKRDLKARVRNLRELGIGVPNDYNSMESFELVNYLGSVNRETIRKIKDLKDSGLAKQVAGLPLFSK